MTTLATPTTTGPLVDRTALRVNQALIIALLLLAFVLDQPALVLFVLAVMALGTALPRAALFQRLYHDLLRPRGWLRPDLQAEAAAPHRFAQGVGAGVLLGASVALLAGSPVVGWALTLLVVLLAAVNLLFGFCVGCFLYFQLERVGLLGDRGEARDG